MTHWIQQRRQLAIEHLQQSGWLRHVQWFDEIDSTSSFARRQIACGMKGSPALFVADRQTAGRGRTDRTWWSPDGCLMFSLVVGEEVLCKDAAAWPLLSLIVGVAAARAVEAVAPPTQIQLKWPNDLYLNGLKLAGILVEAVPQTHEKMAFIIGMGLNVNVQWDHAPSDIRARACSLSEHTHHPDQLHKETILIQVIDALEFELAQWRAGHSQWWNLWSQRSLLTGRQVELRLPGDHTLVGICQGITYFGQLIIRDQANRLHTIQSAEVTKLASE